MSKLIQQEFDFPTVSRKKKGSIGPTVLISVSHVTEKGCDIFLQGHYKGRTISCKLL